MDAEARFAELVLAALDALEFVPLNTVAHRRLELALRLVMLAELRRWAVEQERAARSGAQG